MIQNASINEIYTPRSKSWFTFQIDERRLDILNRVSIPKIWLNILWIVVASLEQLYESFG